MRALLALALLIATTLVGKQTPERRKTLVDALEKIGPLSGIVYSYREIVGGGTR